MLVNKRDELRAHLTKRNIETRPILVGSMLRQPLGILGRPCPVAEDVYERGLWFSVHPLLTASDRHYIIDCIREFFSA